ncbi:MAG TPA: hypothetical protein VM144_04320 [Aestuariivirga sp.]|nr:hypothetical protein [Aestuariivirga sp.]
MTNFENLDPTGGNRNTGSANANSAKYTAIIIAVLALVIGALIWVFNDWGTTNYQVSQTSTTDNTASTGQENPPVKTATPAPAAPPTNP